MSLTIPRLRRDTAPKPHPKHRASDQIRDLKHQLAGAGHLIEALRIQVEEHRTGRDAANEKACRTDEAEQRAVLAEQELADQNAELYFLRSLYANDNRATIPTLGARDTSDPLDQVTIPDGTPHVGDQFPDDYLDQTRTSWKSPVIHLNQAPFARRPTVDVDPLSLSARFMAGETRVTVNGGPFAKASA